jgi:hypothetical protein
MKQNIICWFEIYVKDIRRARAFYTNVLNQKINEVVETPGRAGMPKLKIASFATGKDSSIVSGALIFKTGNMFSSTVLLMRGAIMCILLLSSSCFLFAQDTVFENYRLKPVLVNMSITSIDGIKAVRVIRDTAVKGADLPTFVRLNNTDKFNNGTIEVTLLSRLLPGAETYARGFIGLAFRINKDNTRFECMYIRPTNGRAEDQLRRNHATQYFSYPDYKFDRLRKEAAGQYESYADMGLNEWIKMKVVVKNAQAKLYLNDNPQPVLIVNELKLGAGNSGAVGLFLDGGTDAFFRDIKVVKDN